METPAIVLNQLRHTYDGKRFALDGVSFEVRKGEVFGLLGKNGAGKTTLIKAMTTLIRPTSGSLSILGRDPVRQGKEIRSRIGVVQQSESFDFTSVEGNFDIYGVLWGVPKDLRQRRREELIERFELGEFRKQRSFDLSGGQQRRVQVAREFMHDMEILFLDEPTVGLDALARRRILKYLRERARRGLSIVFTTHILHEADMLCDRIAVLHQGSLLATDTPESLKQRFGGAREVRVEFGDALPPAHVQEFVVGLHERGASVLQPEGAVAPGMDTSSFEFRSDKAETLLPWITTWSGSRGHVLERLSISEPTLEGAFLGMIGGGEQDGLDEPETERRTSTNGRPGNPPPPGTSGGLRRDMGVAK